MLKSISNLGKELSKTEKKQINGGFGDVFFDSCSGIEIRFECLSNPTCGWNGTSCYTKTPHII
ncbi:hypothetical protein [uncultured Dokdonia sp.]|uniref:hypothetical protein n=1 Tax=uncultured Dokdonia sp. TaxID=575653 RepID=UPI00260701DB|nr:hypothetical protein [uncultured Dokdonia sp.]